MGAAEQLTNDFDSAAMESLLIDAANLLANPAVRDAANELSMTMMAVAPSPGDRVMALALLAAAASTVHSNPMKWRDSTELLARFIEHVHQQHFEPPKRTLH